jgi:hypothetical protein
MGTLNDYEILWPSSLTPFTVLGSTSGKLGVLCSTTLSGCVVSVLRGHSAGQGEVLEDGGEEEEQFIAGNALPRQMCFPGGTKDQPCGHWECANSAQSHS